MMLIADKLIGHIVPVRFVLFAFVGGIGLFIHMSVLWFALTVAGAAFNPAQAVAAVAAMTSNFFVNNVFTYRDRRLRGFPLVRGLFAFYAICALGGVANVGIAGYVFSRNEVWWLVGLAGIVVGSVWNYAVSSVFTWKQKNIANEALANRAIPGHRTKCGLMMHQVLGKDAATRARKLLDLSGPLQRLAPVHSRTLRPSVGPN
jgi:dolichol-phosphate mannosyltransferase